MPSARPEARSGLAHPLEIPQKADSVCFLRVTLSADMPSLYDFDHSPSGSMLTLSELAVTLSDWMSTLFELTVFSV